MAAAAGRSLLLFLSSRGGGAGAGGCGALTAGCFPGLGVSRHRQQQHHRTEHMQTHQAGPSLSSQKPRVFKCDTCEKAFAKPSQLERHSRIHTGERPFHCTLCEKAFNQKSALQVHMKKHTGERPYKCDYCVMGFTQKSNMKLHMKRAHSYTGALQEPAGPQEQGTEELSQTLHLEEVVPEAAGEWQALANVF